MALRFVVWKGSKRLDHVTELLSAYLDGEASLPDRRTVEAHLAECAECRAELEDLRRLKSLLAHLPQHQPPRSFTIGPRRARPAALSGSAAGFLRALASVAAALLVVAVSLSLAIQGLPRQSATTAAPRLVSAPTSPATAAPVSRPFAAAEPASSAQAQAGAAQPPAVGGSGTAAESAPGALAAPLPRQAQPAGSAVPGVTGQSGPHAAASAPVARGPAAAAKAVPGGASGASEAQAEGASRAQAKPATAGAPVNAPRLAGELLLLVLGVATVVYSVRWWRA